MIQFVPAQVWIKTYGRLLAVVAFVAVLLLAFRLGGLGEQFELATLQRSIAGHPLGGVVFFVVLFSLGNLLLIPGWVFLASAVYVFGVPLGGLATYAAACVSCVVTFLVIRLLGGDALRRLKNPDLAGAERCAGPVGHPLLPLRAGHAAGIAATDCALRGLLRPVGHVAGQVMR